MSQNQNQKQEKTRYFWNLPGECFAGKKFSEDVTEFFDTDESRRKKFMELGKIVTEKPETIEKASQSELTALRETVFKLKAEVKTLKAKK